MTGWRGRAPILLYILHSGNLYGTERMALATLEGLDEYAARVVFAPMPNETGSVLEAARAAGYGTVVFDTRGQLLRGLVPLFLRHRHIDVIGVGVGPSMICHVLSHLFRVRLRQLQVAHGGNEDARAYGSKHRLNAIPIVTVAVSEFVRQKLLEHGVRADRLCVIDNFLSRSQLGEYGQRAAYAGSREAAPRAPDRSAFRVAVVSRIDAIKKVDLLIEAIERHGLDGFRFDLYGTGTELDTLRRRSAPLRNVTFHGYVSDVKARLVDADLLLHLCPEEPFGLVILEAFLTGLVVVVPDTGGASALVDEGRSGFHFKANDPDDLRRVLEQVRARPDTALQAVAAAGREALGSRYGQSEGIRRYRAAFEAAGTARR